MSEPSIDRQTVAVQAQRQLSASNYPTLRSVRCRMQDDVLVLTGSLSSYHLKQVAQTVVRDVKGVGVVVNLIDVA